jgi:ABC-2 type transport system ATP-binding protein
MEEAEQLADRVAIIARGRIVAEDTPAGLRQINPNTRIRFRLTEASAGLADGIEGVQVLGEYAHIETARPTAVLATLTSRAQARGIEIPELTVLRETLEDAYLALVGEAESSEQ